VRVDVERHVDSIAAIHVAVGYHRLHSIQTSNIYVVVDAYCKRVRMESSRTTIARAMAKKFNFTKEKKNALSHNNNNNNNNN
jgi:hypothetical protein